jgi:hypothetical protein
MWSRLRRRSATADVMHARPFRITLPDELLPVQAFLNVLSDHDFLPAVAGMGDRMSIGCNGVGCELPGDVDWQEGDGTPVPPGYIRCYVSQLDEEAEIPLEEFFDYLRKALNTFIEDYPEQKSAAEAAFQQCVTGLREVIAE